MINRRQAIQLGAATLALPALHLRAGDDSARPALIQRPIPASGELLPAVGMGTSRTFDTDDDPQSLANLRAVMQAFVDGGGSVIDSSPMYGRAESRVGDVLRAMQPPPKLFAATKVWVKGKDKGIAQMQESARRMNVERFDLIAVHNLKDWKTHLATLREWKEQGKVRYIGITTSHGRDHDDFMQVMKREPLDFVQFSYNIEDRETENKLLPLAADRGIATMINRPYQRGSLFGEVRGVPLPALAGELGCASWGQFFLKFILAHPAVTCIIPATAKVEHMADNMGANFGPVPDAGQRAEMLRIYESL
ncbi:MAG: aldo/keto reductase [Halioglobus sp.]|nr:aldo/keto reductase [Halioglobus sp.]|tara:strand:+ start:17 stop:937 length:921 start_codon:yes stop_codon:yes gene_type:complete